MKTIVITGGSGFIGTNLVEFYVCSGYEVFNLDIVKPQKKDHLKYWISVDILDRKKLIDCLKEINPEILFHFAARTDLNGKTLNDYSTNTEGVKNITLAINNIKNIKSIIFASSMLVCKLGYQPHHENDYCPDTIYGESKAIGECIVRDANINKAWIIVRPTSIWGPWFRVPYRNFFDVVREGLYFHPLDLRVKRSYGFVLNSVYQLVGLADIMENNCLHETFYLADYEPVDLKEWAETIQRSSNSNNIRELPRWFFKVGSFLGDLTKVFGVHNPPMSTSRYKNMTTETILDTAKLQSYLPKLPYSMQQGVSITCEWLDAQKGKIS